MIRSLVTLIITIFFFTGIYSTNTFAQEESTSKRDAKSPVMLRQWTVTPSPMQKNKEIGPVQSEWMGQSGLKDNSRTSPAQRQFGKNLHLAEEEHPLQTSQSHLLTKADFSELKQITTTLVPEIIDPLRFRLQDKKTVQLVGIDIPDFDAYEPGEISLKAKEKLTGLLENKQVRIYQTKNKNTGRSNRMGHMLAHAVLPDNNLWVQGVLLSEGLARVRPSERNPEMAAAMIALEDQARGNRLGIWADDQHYFVMSPTTAYKAQNDWGIVEGKIVNAALVRNTLYLNFGEDWRTDFTVSLNSKTRKLMLKNNINPQTLGGKTVRVRGWIEEYNGPLIELIHPVWLEIISEEE